MRTIMSATLLLLAACDIDSNPDQDTVTIKYDREQIKKSAADAGRTAKEVATGVASVAKDTGRAIKREVGDVDVDVKVTRNRAEQVDQSN